MLPEAWFNLSKGACKKKKWEMGCHDVLMKLHGLGFVLFPAVRSHCSAACCLVLLLWGQSLLDVACEPRALARAFFADWLFLLVATTALSAGGPLAEVPMEAFRWFVPTAKIGPSGQTPD
jgi:hypothetical protein